MTAFLFGPSGKQLYGFHHVPVDPSPRGVVLCPSWGSEYEYAHRSLLVLARQLAGAGWHVLRFDYSGTGDSWGETTDADLERWVGEVGLAVEELRAVAGIEVIDVVGLRLGAALAARAAASATSGQTSDRPGNFGRVVLWDPVVDGARWVAGFAEDRESVAGLVELDRSVVTTDFFDQLAGVSPAAFDDLPSGEALLLLTQGGNSDAGAAQLQDREGLECVSLEQSSPWIEDQSIWTGQVPMGAVREIAEWLG